MAQTKKKRRRKHKGTQGGSIDRRTRSRPRSREEARAQARASTTNKRNLAPSWSGSINRGLFGGLIFLVLMLVAFKRPIGEALGLAGVMAVAYVPMGYYLDRFFYRRRKQKEQRERQAKREQTQGRR